MNIVIKEPCHANWNEMSLSDQGRFCSACSKEVVDFSKKTKLQTLIYLEQHEDICGRVPSSHLLNTSIKLNLDELAKSKMKPLQKFAFLCFLAFGLSLFSCQGNEHEVMGEISVNSQQFYSPLPNSFFESLQRDKGKITKINRTDVINLNSESYQQQNQVIFMGDIASVEVQLTGFMSLKENPNSKNCSKINWARMYKWTEEEWSRFNQRELRLTKLENKLFPNEDEL